MASALSKTRLRNRQKPRASGFAAANRYQCRTGFTGCSSGYGCICNENSIDITFDKYMMVSTLSSSTVTVTANGQLDEFGQPVSVSGSVQPVDPQNDPKCENENVQFARSFRFTPDQQLSSGEYAVWVSQMVKSYAEGNGL